MKKCHRIVLVIGNGFDLDLGLKTRYYDFMKSEIFSKYLVEKNVPNSNSDGKEINLFNYLNKKSELCQWFDVESALAELASRGYDEDRYSATSGARLASKTKCSSEELKSFHELHVALCHYIKLLDYSNIATNSSAINLLKIVMQSCDAEILSFNYTDIRKLESKAIASLRIPIDYIHGQVSDDSIILGIQDELDIDPSYCFMIKSFSSHFKSHNVRRKLLDANEIIFFGHSLGSTDYHYFEDLFKRQSQANGENKADEKLILRIFTYDEDSRRDILIRLREMNNKRTDMLYDLCDFEIYRTKDDSDVDKIDSYLDQLRTRIFESRPKDIPVGVFH